MNKQVRIILLTMLAMLIAGCGSTRIPATVQVAQPSEPQNQDTLRLLSELADIKEELKQLRNAVEEVQFETENAKRRQQDLFQDLDRRLVSIERNDRILNPPVIDPVTGEVVENSEFNSSTTQSGQSDNQSENNGGLSTEVVVIDSNSNNSTTVDSIDPNQDTTSTINSTIQPTTESASVSLAEQEAYDQAFDLLKKSRYEDSIAQFQQFADNWPTSQLADDAYYWMSEARYVNREFELALTGFRTVVSRYPNSQRVPEALLKVGYIQYDIGAYEDAADTFKDILARFPGHQVTVPAQTRLRRIESTIQ